MRVRVDPGEGFHVNMVYNIGQRLWPFLVHLCHTVSGRRRRIVRTSQLVVSQRLDARGLLNSGRTGHAEEWPPVAVFRRFSSIRTLVYVVRAARLAVCCSSSRVRLREAEIGLA